MNNKNMNEILEGILSVFPVFNKKIRKIGEDILKDEEISRAHVHLIESLRRNGACSMTQLGKMLSISKPNVTTLVDKLVELEMVKRKFDENDRRITLIELSEEGHNFFNTLLQTMKIALSKNMQKFTEDDLDLFKETIKNMKLLVSKMNEGREG